MSESSSDQSSECTNPESFELITDVTSNQRNERIILSSSPSYASTECAEELNDPDVDELKMDQMNNFETDPSTPGSNDEMEQQLQNTIQNLENLNSNLLQNKQQTIDNVVSGNNLTQATKVQDQISRSTEIVTSLESGGGSMTSSTKSIDAEKINFSKPIPLKSCNTSSTTTLTAQQSSSHNVSITAGLFGWFSENEFLNKVAEKAMSSVDSVITTLDPGMKEVLYAGGDIHVLIASANDQIITSVRDAFLDVFKRATVKGIESQSQLAVQLVGVHSAKQAATLRLAKLRENISVVAQNQVIIVIENFLVEMAPGSWYEMSYLILDDPLNQLQLDTFTQTTPIETDYINYLTFETPPDYLHRSYGYAVTVGKLINERLNWQSDDWHSNYAGLELHQIIYLAARNLAHLYKQKLKSLGRTRLR